MSQKNQKETSHEKEIAEIWKLFRETDRKMEAMFKKLSRKIEANGRQIEANGRQIKANGEQIKVNSRQIKAMSEKADRKMEAMFKKLTMQIKAGEKRIKYLDNLFSGQWGKLMESLVRGDLVRLLKDQNISVNRILHDEEIQGTHEERQWEFDIAAVNGKELVIVEVKTTMKTRDIDHFIKKVEKFTTLRPRFKGSRIYGAMAYLKANQSSDVYAEKKGLFVIRATGSSASITNKKGFKPKVFS